MMVWRLSRKDVLLFLHETKKGIDSPSPFSSGPHLLTWELKDLKKIGSVLPCFCATFFSSRLKTNISDAAVTLEELGVAQRAVNSLLLVVHDNGVATWKKEGRFPS
jgi:hypothetical protein